MARKPKQIDEIWSNVDKALSEKQMSLLEMAQKSGLNYDTVRGWRTKTIYPDIDQAKRMADAVGITMEQLFFDEDVEEGYRKEIIRLREKEEKLKAIEALLFQPQPGKSGIVAG